MINADIVMNIAFYAGFAGGFVGSIVVLAIIKIFGRKKDE